MAGSGSIQDRLKEGIEAARRGDKVAAQRLLRQVVDRDPNNEVAWMWLASALENLQDRRQALEQALRINPQNRRAQDALSQIEALLPPTRARRSAPARRTAPAIPRVGTGSPVSGAALIIIGVVAALVVLVLIIYSIVSSQQPALPNEITRQAIESVLLNTSIPSATINPDTYTATPFYGVIVTAENQQVLPPSFTPTFTPSPTSTPLPTETPIPMSMFSVLYTSLNAGEAQPALYQMKGDGTGDQQIGSGSDGFNDIAYAPNGQLIAFVRTITYDKDGKSVTSPELFVAPLNNLAGARQITKLGTDHLASPAWASDSIQLAFVSNYDGNDEIWYVTEDGNNLRQVTQSDGVDKDPAWSPDGSTILFASERANFQKDKPSTGLTEIFSMGADGSNVVQLTDDQNSGYSPAWSPDGKKVVFVSDRKGDGDIYTMNPDGQNQVLLTVDDKGAEDRHPAFVPITQQIVFLSNRGGDNFQFYVMDARGQTIVRLADPGRDIQSFAFRSEGAAP